MPKNAYKKPALQRNKSKDRGISRGTKPKGYGPKTKTKKTLREKLAGLRPATPAKKKQGYAAREDESLGMRRGKESTKKQSMKDRRDESYGKWGKRKGGVVNKPKPKPKKWKKS